MRLKLGGTHTNCLIAKSCQKVTVILVAPPQVIERIDCCFLEDETDEQGPLEQLENGGVYRVTLSEWWDDEDWYLRISDVVPVCVP